MKTHAALLLLLAVLTLTLVAVVTGLRPVAVQAQPEKAYLGISSAGRPTSPGFSNLRTEAIQAVQTMTSSGVITPLDIALVFDVSGSMDYETTCFGCWEKTTNDILNYPFPANGNFNALNYRPDDGTYASPTPAGGFNIFWDNRSGPLAAGHPVCSDTVASTVDGDNYHYLVHEAEFYSRDMPHHGWEFEQRSPGQGFWVLQRRPEGSNRAYLRAHSFATYSQSNLAYYPRLQGAAYNAECFDNSGGVGSLSGECWRTRALALGESAPSNVPWVEYDFTPDWTGEAHIWIRAIGGYQYGYEWYGASPPQLRSWRDSVYWQVDNGQIQGGPFTNLNDGGYSSVSDLDWRWVKLGSTAVTSGTQYTFKLYQGSAGFNRLYAQ
ncbi:MAG: hypothetical protein AB1801_28325 [Chloroflexota bacterium]